MALDRLDLDTETNRGGIGAVQNAQNDGTVRLQNLDRKEAEKIEKTNHVAVNAIQTTDYPQASDSALNGKVTLGAPERSNSIDPEKLATSWEAINRFPALAWESVRAGLAKEKQSNSELDGHIKRAQKIQDEMKNALKGSTELTAIPDKGSHEISPQLRAIAKELKESGLDLKLEEGGKITKEKALELKSLISSFIDQRRSDLQILFTTKIQVVIQNIGSIMEALKNIVKDNTRLNSTIVGHSGGR